MATTLIGAHGLEHMYGHSFAVLVTQIYQDLGLDPIQAGVLSAVRQLTGGLTQRRQWILGGHVRAPKGSGAGGQHGPHRRGLFPSIRIANLHSNTGLPWCWHPREVPFGIPLLWGYWPSDSRAAEDSSYPSHRSTGNVGDVIGPLAAGGLLLVLGWRWIMGGGTPILLILALAVYLLLRNVGGPKPGPIDFCQQIWSPTAAFEGSLPWKRNVGHLHRVRSPRHGRPVLRFLPAPLFTRCRRIRHGPLHGWRPCRLAGGGGYLGPLPFSGPCPTGLAEGRSSFS